jgi:hypothetical protein
VGEHHRDVGVATERRLTDQALIQHAAQRVDVRPPVDLVAGDLLGGHVVDRAHQVTAQARAGLVGEPLGETEVRQVDVIGAIRPGAGVEQDVRRLHVAVHQPARMGGVEGAGDLGDDRHRLARLHASAL